MGISIDWPALYSGIYGIGGSLIIVWSKLRVPLEIREREKGFRLYEKVSTIIAFSLLVTSFMIVATKSIFQIELRHAWLNVLASIFQISVCLYFIKDVEIEHDFLRGHPIIVLWALFFLVILTSVLGIFREYSIQMYDWQLLDPIIAFPIFVGYFIQTWLMLSIDKIEEKERINDSNYTL